LLGQEVARATSCADAPQATRGHQAVKRSKRLGAIEARALSHGCVGQRLLRSHVDEEVFEIGRTEVEARTLLMLTLVVFSVGRREAQEAFPRTSAGSTSFRR
jgi:hypothetical protein